MNWSLNKISLRNPISLGILILICLSFSLQRLQYKNWRPDSEYGPPATSFDALGYYLYLPSAFVYNDFSNLSYLNNILPTYHLTTDFTQSVEGPQGKYVNKYPIGQAILFSVPFFLAHYIYAPLSDYPRDGFSKPYQKSIAIGCIVYAILGLFFLRKVLLYYFSDLITGLTLALICLGTNFYYYASFENLLPHNQLFFVFSLILYSTISFYEKPVYWKVVLIGCLTGLAGLIRPTDAIIGVIPVLWGVTDINGLTARLKNYWKHILIMLLSVFILISIQFIYWKLQSGEFIFETYNNVQLSLSNPHLANVLFSFRKGWFLYTPVSMLALIGFYFLWKNYRNLFWPISLFTVLNIWIISSWGCWWYGGCYGQRSMVQSYALLSIPLGSFLYAVNRSKRRIIKWIVIVICVFFVTLNLFQIWQYRQGLIHYEYMTREAYFSVFGKTTFPDNFTQMLSQPDYSFYKQEVNSYEEFSIISEKYESDSVYGTDEMVFEGKRSLFAGNITPISFSYSFRLDSLPVLPEYKAYCIFKLFAKKPLTSGNLIMVIEIEGLPPITYRNLDFASMNYSVNTWHDMEIWLDVPRFTDPKAILKVYMNNPVQQEFYIDNLEIAIKRKIYL